MGIEEFFESISFARLLGVEVTEVADGYAEGRVEMREGLSWSADRAVAYGGATFTLTDTAGGAALVSEVDQPVLTADMRIDYLNTGTGDLHVEADVVRLGGDVGVVDVNTYTTDGNHMVITRGAYKTG